MQVKHIGFARHPAEPAPGGPGQQLMTGRSGDVQRLDTKRSIGATCDILPPRVRSQNPGSFVAQPGSLVDSPGSNVVVPGSFVGFPAQMSRSMHHKQS